MSGGASLPLSAIYRWPLLVAIVVAVGLVAALSGEGAERVFSWFALAFPVAVVAVCLLSRLFGRRREEKQEHIRD
jgi:hypothetical protein